MKNQIIELPTTTFTDLANHFKHMHPAGIRGAVDVHSPDYYEEAGRHMVPTYDDGLNLVLKLVSRV